jgi:2,4-dienoyl-CoA reductase-like NADH-dependent reductase (Old Yellow Enzyme family)
MSKLFAKTKIKNLIIENRFVMSVRKAACISDNGCFGPGMAGEGIYCVVEKKERNKG